jgi:hypothetical protein
VINFGDINYTNTLVGNPALATGQTYFGSTGLLFEGSTADNFEGLLTTANITGSDKTWTLPNTTGTIALTSSAMTGTFDGNNFAGGAVSTGDLLYGSGNGVIAERSIGSTGQVLQVVGGLPVWVATSTLGIGGGATAFTGLSDTQGSLTANRLIFANSGGTALTDSANLIFDGTNFNLGGTNTGLAFQGTRMFYASTTNGSIAIGEGAAENMIDNNYAVSDEFNIFIGYRAGQNASSTDEFFNQNKLNNSIGYYAGYNNTGEENSMLGSSAGRNNTGYENVLIGRQSGNNNIGNRSNIIGYNAGFSNTGSTNNIFGSSAGYSNSGGFNSLLGSSAGYSNSGSYNNLLGALAGYSNSGGFNNILGYQAAYNNAGSENNIFGFNAGYYNTGSYNNLFGRSAGFNSTGSYSEFIGYETGARMSASSTVAIGGLALRGGSGSAFSGNNATTTNNTAIGYGAGYNVATGGDNNILLGYQAADSLTTGANNIIIGYDVEAPSNTGSNQLNIGNLIFGTGLDGTGTTLASGNVGIGTTTPSARLSIQKTGVSGAATVGLDQYLQTTNSVASAV